MHHAQTYVQRVIFLFYEIRAHYLKKGQCVPNALLLRGISVTCIGAMETQHSVPRLLNAPNNCIIMDGCGLFKNKWDFLLFVL